MFVSYYFKSKEIFVCASYTTIKNNKKFVH
jgi:hypothetical protein